MQCYSQKSQGDSVLDLTVQIYYRWSKEYGELEVLECENTKLKKLLAEAHLD